MRATLYIVRTCSISIAVQATSSAGYFAGFALRRLLRGLAEVHVAGGQGLEAFSRLDRALRD